MLIHIHTIIIIILISKQCSYVVMTKLIVKDQLVYLMNVEHRLVADDIQTKPTKLGHESACRLLFSTPTITI